MENDSAFQPTSQSNLIVAAVSPPTAVQLGGSQTSGAQIAVYALNSGTVVVGLAYAPTAAQAATNAVLPTAGTPQQCIVMLPGQAKTFTVPPGQFWTAVAASTTANVYLQTGFGI